MPHLIAVALYHRGHFSQGKARHAFGYEGYHWAIAVMPPEGHKGERRVFDATDTSIIDPVTFRLTNPAMEWMYRVQKVEDPALAAKLVGHVVVGQAPETASFDDFESLFSKIPLPVKNSNPQESCVTWAIKAIKALQEKAWLPEFDLEHFKDYTLDFADKRLQDTEQGQPSMKYYRV